MSDQRADSYHQGMLCFPRARREEFENLLHYGWNFDDQAAMVELCTLLFGLDQATPESAGREHG